MSNGSKATIVIRRSTFGGQRAWRLLAVSVTILFALTLSGPAQPTAPPRVRPLSNDIAASGEFTFVRIIYDSPHSPYNYGYGGAWRVDFPEADKHFMSGIREWVGTNLRLSGGPVQLRPTGESLFNYPLAYIVEPGHMELSDKDAAALREYLLRGGFLFLDDFHGEVEWQRARQQVKKMLPEYEIKDLPTTHPISHSYFDLDGVVQVPGVGGTKSRRHL